MDFVDERETEEKVDLLEYWRVIVKRKGVLLLFASVVIVLVGIRTFTATPKYQAKATLLIEDESAKMMSIEDEFGYRMGRTDLRFFNTQLRLLQSESLADRVVTKMNLLSRPEFSEDKKKNSFISGFKNFITLKWITHKKKAEEDEQAIASLMDPNSEIIEMIQGGIDVSPIRETKLVEVSYKSEYPVLAAEIVNTLADEFISFSIEKKYETTQQASDFLSEQIANLREDLAAKERELQKYGKEKELFFLSDKESTAVSKFADLNQAFTQSQIDRINKEAAYRELRDLNVNSLPQYVNNPLIQDLKTDYAGMKNEYEQKKKTFKSDYPEMISLKAKLDNMRDELRIEIKKAVDAAESEYNSALKRESSLSRLLEQQKTDVIQMNSNAILYNSIRIEVENKRKLLESLVSRQSETQVSARLGGLKTSYVSIIDRAKVPKDPVSPKKKMNLILALLVGIMGGVGLCFVLDYLDNTVKGPEDAEKLTGLPSLGVIPYLPPEGMKSKKKYGYYSGYNSYGSYGEDNPGKDTTLPEIKEIELVNYLHPRFYLSEDYRTVRTSILLSHAESPPKTIVFLSSLPSEGKTVSAANMAVAFAQLNQRVLVVDSDMRKPRLHRIFKVKNTGGLSGYLTGKVPIEDAVKKTEIENIWIIPSGPIPPNPSELLNSQKMKLMLEEMKKGFDVIMLDSPPVLAVIDGVILTSIADSAVYVIEAGKTTNKGFVSGVEELKKAKRKIIGVLFNEAKVSRRGDYSGYYKGYSKYYRYRRYYGSGEEESEGRGERKEEQEEEGKD